MCTFTRVKMPAESVRGRRGFTLIELLVVIAIIALLSAILMPSLRKAKDAAKAVLCASQLRQLGVAYYGYIGDFNSWLPTVQEFCPTDAGWAGPNKIEPDAFFYVTYLGGENPIQLSNALKIYRCPMGPKSHVGLDAWRVDNLSSFAQNQQGLGGSKGWRHNINDWKTPAKAGLLAELSAIADGSAWEVSSWAPNITDRHLDRGNLLFLDGHVQSISVQDFKTQQKYILYGK